MPSPGEVFVWNACLTFTEELSLKFMRHRGCFDFFFLVLNDFFLNKTVLINISKHSRKIVNCDRKHEMSSNYPPRPAVTVILQENCSTIISFNKGNTGLFSVRESSISQIFPKGRIHRLLPVAAERDGRNWHAIFSCVVDKWCILEWNSWKTRVRVVGVSLLRRMLDKQTSVGFQDPSSSGTHCSVI